MKKGITVSTLAIAAIIMLIVTTTVSVVGVRSIQSAKFENYKSIIRRVSDVALEYYTTNKKIPTTGEVIANETLNLDILTELSNNGDNQRRLYVIDTSALDITVNIGKGNVQNKDVFVMAEGTNNVYYLQGYEYKGIVYFTLK